MPLSVATTTKCSNVAVNLFRHALLTFGVMPVLLPLIDRSSHSCTIAIRATTVHFLSHWRTRLATVTRLATRWSVGPSHASCLGCPISKLSFVERQGKTLKTLTSRGEPEHPQRTIRSSLVGLASVSFRCGNGQFRWSPCPTGISGKPARSAGCTGKKPRSVVMWSALLPMVSRAPLTSSYNWWFGLRYKSYFPLTFSIHAFPIPTTRQKVR